MTTTTATQEEPGIFGCGL